MLWIEWTEPGHGLGHGQGQPESRSNLELFGYIWMELFQLGAWEGVGAMDMYSLVVVLLSWYALGELSEDHSGSLSP